MRRLWPVLLALLGLTLLAAPPASAAVATSVENRISGSPAGSNNLVGIEPRLSENAVRENVALAYELASGSPVAARGGSAFAREAGILRDAARGKGNFGLGSGTRAEAERLGRAWVGDGAKLASDGKTLVSADGLRQFRPPSFKPNLGIEQANFEQRLAPSGQWFSNGHLDIGP
jgi:hypothetical protein